MNSLAPSKLVIVGSFIFSMRGTPRLRLIGVLIREQADNHIGDPSQRQHMTGRTELGGRPGHSPDDAGGLILGDRCPATVAKVEQPLSAVAAHPCEQRCNAGPGPVPTDALEEHVDRRAITTRPGLGRIVQQAVRTQNQVIVGSGKEDFPLAQVDSLGDKLDLSPHVLAKPLAQSRGKRRIHMLNDHDGRLQAGGNPGEDLRQRERATGGATQQDQGMKGQPRISYRDGCGRWLRLWPDRWRGLADQPTDDIDLLEQRRAAGNIASHAQHGRVNSISAP